MKPLPNEKEIERSVLASILIYPDDREKALSLLTVDDFYATSHQIIFEKCRELSPNGNSLEVEAVWAELAEDEQKKVGSAFELSKLLDVPIASNIEHYINILKDRKARRRTIELVYSIDKRIHRKNGNLAKVINDAEAIISEIQGSKAEAEKSSSYISLNEIYLEKLEEKPLVKNFIYENDHTIVYAPGGVGKSLILQDIAMALGAGLNSLWGVFEISKPCVSFFVQSENSQRSIYQRSYKKCSSVQDYVRGLSNVIYAQSFGSPQIAGHVTDSAFRSKIINLAKRAEDGISEKIDLIIFDPLISYHDGDENDNSRMRTTLDYILEISNQIESTPIVIHHANKEQGLRGATAIRDWARSIIKLEDGSNKGQKRIKLTHEKCNNAEIFNSFVLEMDKYLNFSPIDLIETMSTRAKERCLKVKEALELLGGSTDTKSKFIAQYKEISAIKTEPTIHNHIDDAVKYGFIQREYYKEGKIKKARYFID